VAHNFFYWNNRKNDLSYIIALVASGLMMVQHNETVTAEVKVNTLTDS